MIHVALVGPEIEENLSLRYLASSLESASYRSEIIAFNQPADLAYALHAVLSLPEPPLVVGISLAFQWRAQDFLALAMALRERGYGGHITVGGHFATFAAKDLLRDFPEVDSVCLQEAEGTMCTLVAAVERSARAKKSGGPEQGLEAVPGLALRAGGQVVMTGHAALPDLARLPWPDRRGEPAACFGHRIAPLVSSRGCYANCTFCCIASWHEQSLPGVRYRLREVDAVADEMVSLQRTRGIDIFVFHDDNFFVPGHKKNAERFAALADALREREIGPFATVVKARPTDCDPTVFRILQERLHCIRVYIGVETDADQGLRTLRRWAKSSQNHDAIELVRELGLYTCFNMLIFDPDTTVDSLRKNVAFMRYAAEFPSNFGRVELYAGTPLLARMQTEGRVQGDYMQWDYSLGDGRVERIFDLSMRAFFERNFGHEALANRIMATRFDVEVCRHFHPDRFRAEWLAEGKELSRLLAIDSADGLDAIVGHVEEDRKDDDALVARVSETLRATEKRVDGRARDLARRIERVLQRGKPLTDIGDRVATSLQTQRLAAGGM